MASVYYPGTKPLKDDEIRLIRLLPGQWADQVRCELVYGSLQNVRPYHALSYVWGSSRITRPILLDEHAFSVTVNLESALRHLRHQLDDTLLWVDALCINQANNHERTHQVQLMGKIYRSCKSVLVYLSDGIGRHNKPVRGPKDNSSAPPTTAFFNDDRDIPQIQRFVQDASIGAPANANSKRSGMEMQDTVKVFSFIRTLSWITHLPGLPIFAPNAKGWNARGDVLHLFEALRQLMHAPYTPWWGRIWVVQEVILPPKITIICGTVSAPWTMFARAASRCLYHIHHCCSRHAESIPRDYLHVLKDFCQRVLDIEDLRSTYVEDEFDTELAVEESMIPEINNHRIEQRSMISLLRRFRSRKASDPRDKVYALLSLVQNSIDRPAFLPDYSLSEPEVYRRAALESIYSSGSLSVLNADLSRKFRQDLPSWVPDWETPGDFTHDTRMDAIEMYDVCANDPVNPTTVRADGKEKLVLDGRYVDAVVATGEVMFSDSSDAFCETLTNWLSVKETYRGIMAAEKTDQVLWRVLCADVLCYPHAANTKPVFRRMSLVDELMFVTWALLSTKSPFTSPKIPLEGYISKTARIWKALLDFEIAIANGKPEEAARNFGILYPDGAKRRSLISDACKDMRTTKDKTGEQLKIDLIKYGTLSDSDIKNLGLLGRKGMLTDEGNTTLAIQKNAEDEAIKQISQKLRLKACHQIPWSKVLEIVKPEQLKRLGNGSGIGFIPYETQIAIIDRSIVSATKARRLFLTERGYIGLGPAGLQRDDKLFLIKGGRTPFILRGEVETKYNYLYLNTHIFRHDRLKVVGDCYAYGLMDSSLVKEHLFHAQSEEWREIALV